MPVRTRSMSAGLDASTVTPGSTAPDESWTTPTMLARSCAAARVERSNTSAETITTMPRNTRRMSPPFAVSRVSGPDPRLPRDTRPRADECQPQNVDFPVHYGEDDRLLGGESAVQKTLSGVLIAIAAATGGAPVATSPAPFAGPPPAP